MEAGLGQRERRLATGASPLGSAFLRALTPGRGGYPGRRGAHWDSALSLASLLQPACRPHRYLPPPLPHCAQGLSAQARWACLIRKRPACRTDPSASLPHLQQRSSAPCALLPGLPPSLEGPRPAGCRSLSDPVDAPRAP